MSVKEIQMKAYLLGIKNDEDAGNEIVWASNSKEAKKQVSLDYENWIDITCRRYPEFDDLHNAKLIDIARKQWQEGWRWFDSETPQPDVEEDEAEFDTWYNNTFVGK